MYEKEVYHFLVLHFPIALFVTGFIFNVFYLLNISSDFSEKIKEYIKWTMGMGVIWSFLSIITGFITALELEYMESIFDFINKPHAYIMILSTVIFSILFIMKNIDKKIFFVLHLCSIILLIYGTHIGAKWADRI